jgi:uncharacterized membrane protein HdeD (DUF308 family)
MTDRMSRDWWIVALQGVAAIVFGVLAIASPGITLLALVILFAAYALVDGVLALISGFRPETGGKPDWWRVAGGVIGIVAGIVAFAMPGVTAYVLLVLIAVWAISTGVTEIVAAYQLRHVIRREWLLVVDGVVAILFGAALILFPSAGALAVVWLIAAYAIVSGVILLAAAFQARQRGRTAHSLSAA